MHSSRPAQLRKSAFSTYHRSLCTCLRPHPSAEPPKGRAEVQWGLPILGLSSERHDECRDRWWSADVPPKEAFNAQQFPTTPRLARFVRLALLPSITATDISGSYVRVRCGCAASYRETQVGMGGAS